MWYELLPTNTCTNVCMIMHRNTPIHVHTTHTNYREAFTANISWSSALQFSTEFYFIFNYCVCMIYKGACATAQKTVRRQDYALFLGIELKSQGLCTKRVYSLSQLASPRIFLFCTYLSVSHVQCRHVQLCGYATPWIYMWSPGIRVRHLYDFLPFCLSETESHHIAWLPLAFTM